MPNDNVLKVATYNANSIRARMGLILDWLGRESPDILCVQETKVQDKDFPAGPIEEAGYHVVFKGQKAHAGVAIISREESHEVAFGIDDGEEPDEARLIRAVIGGISVVNTYVPQGRDPESEHFRYKLCWFERLRAFFERHYTLDGLLVWVGDLNVALEPIDVYDPKALEGHVCYRPEVREALQRVGEWGFVDVFRRHHPGEPRLYTYYDYRARNPVERGIGWRVDHIWATESLAAKSANAWIDTEARLAERPSDHTFLVAEFVL
ncbi:MAG: exodeoxyribonuclease III [Anaerolineae bacterium]|nr:exodeoxyribonuclease III [Anaerolineae bacterium]